MPTPHNQQNNEQTAAAPGNPTRQQHQRGPNYQQVCRRLIMRLPTRRSLFDVPHWPDDQAQPAIEHYTQMIMPCLQGFFLPDVSFLVFNSCCGVLKYPVSGLFRLYIIKIDY